MSKRNILVYFDVGTWTPCGCCSAEPPIALATHAVPITTVHLQEGTPCLHPNKASLQKSHEKASKKIRPCNGPWKNRQTWWNHIKPSYLRYLPSCPSCPSRVSHLGAPGCAAPAVFVCVARRGAHRSRCCPGVDAIAQYRYNRSPGLPFMIYLICLWSLLYIYSILNWLQKAHGMQCDAMWCGVAGYNAM